MKKYVGLVLNFWSFGFGDYTKKLTVVAAYKNNLGEDKVISLKVSVQDCACCGCKGTALPQQIGENTYLTHEYMTDGEMRCWMVENLKEIPSGATANPSGAGSTSVAQYWTTHSSQVASERGYYYNGLAAQNACPVGWSLPTQTQLIGTSGTGVNGIFTTLSNTATVGRTFWYTTTALAGFHDDVTCSWNSWGIVGSWWSSTLGSILGVNGSGTFSRGTSSGACNGFSVRCIKNK